MKKNAILSLLLLLALIFGLSVGVAAVNDLWRHIFNPFFDTASSAHQIIWQIRAPRIFAAALVGASLGVAGLLAQGATNNPIADPALIGTSAGASLGVLIAILTGVASVGSISAVLCALLGALLVTVAVVALARTALQLILVGIGISALVSALVGLLIAASARPDARSISFWSFGSFALVRAESVFLLLPIVVAAMGLAWKIAPGLDLLSLGDASVRHSGADPRTIRMRALLLLSLLIAASVSAVGTISFVALAVPHIARFLSGPRHRPLVLQSALIGALLLVVADTASRTLFPPQELPIGLITSLIGAPLLILILKRTGQVWR